MSEEQDDAAYSRVRSKIEKWIPDASDRHAALELMAYAIQYADAERSDAWLLKDSSKSLKLFAGRLLVCRVTRGAVSMSVMGPISEETYDALNANSDASEQWEAIPGGLLLTFHIEKAPVALDLLKDAFDRFVDEAVSRIRQKVSMDDHVPEAVAYISNTLGRELPQPSERNDDDGSPPPEDDESDEDVDSREPRNRGRAPIFEHSQRAIASLMDQIDQKEIALPDLQRPFVWEDTKVRDLLDSLFIGFPVGTLVLWHASEGKEARAVGKVSDALKANMLVIDGQQRLTSLYAVMKGIEVVEKGGAKRKISIAFRPRDGKFEVADAAIRNDPEFVSNITELWANPNRTLPQIRKELLKSLQAQGRSIDDAYEEAVDHNLARAKAISDYRFPIVDIRKTDAETEVTEEEVAELFVRINNQGTRLGQADFVLTLLAVFHGKLRDRIEDRAIQMSKDAVIELDTQQLLRATCAVGFGRARMSAIYRYLRGAAPTGDSTLAARQARLEKLDQAADECMRLTMWRDYLLRVVHAGFVNRSLVASNNAIVNGYAFYVLGTRARVPKPRLDELISRWLFGAQLTARYSGSSETVFERDLARVLDVKDDPDAFVVAMDGALAEIITGDYWSNTVVGALQTQHARSPAALAFRAAQIVLGARALFSDQLMSALLSPPARGKRAANELHHLFPKKWLSTQGVNERRKINQVANLADVGWWENNQAADKSPASYVPLLRKHQKIDSQWGRNCAEHALPPGWEVMEYDTFLVERRQRMADIIRVAYRTLGGESEASTLAPPWFLPGAAQVWARIVEVELALRKLIRDVYSKKYGDNAATRIENSIPEKAQQSLARALRSRPAGSDPLNVIDYLYLGQLPALIFAADVWPDVHRWLTIGTAAKKHSIETAVQQIVFVRNEIAHIREVSPELLQKANVVCNDVLAMFRS